MVIKKYLSADFEYISDNLTEPLTAEARMTLAQIADDEVFFKWSPDYSVNVNTIDEQHQELIRILNRLFVAVSRQEDDEAIVATLDALTDCTKSHFALEEQLMQQANYKDLEAHKKEHKKLLEQLDLLRQKQALKQEHLYFEILGFVKTWLKGHIVGVDMKYSPAMQKAGLSSHS
jgi:hemerythrin